MDPEAAYSERPGSSHVDLSPHSSRETMRRIDRAGRHSTSC
jgi:hypothetical protein